MIGGPKLTRRTAYLVDGIRTPFGKYAGGLSGIRPDDLLAGVVRHLLNRSGIPFEAVGELVTGCVNQSGEDNRNIARMVVLLAGLPVSTPAITVNRLCASGLSALTYAAKSVITGDQEIVVASGVESMSRAPYVFAKSTKAFQRPAPELFDTSIGWRFTNPRFSQTYPPLEMGETAERVASVFKVSREDQDEFANESHKRCVEAYERGAYSKHVIPVNQLGDFFSDIECDLEIDESIRSNTNLKSLSNLKSAFIKNGTVTAGNSSPLSDGAAALIVASEDACNKLGLRPIAQFVSSGVAGVDPSLMGIGPVPATKIALRKAEWRIQDLDIFEINEAFAAQIIAVQRELQIPSESLNQNGGAIAIGHPLGATGIRLALTAMSRMAESNGRSRALLSACIGVGQGESILLEKC